MPAPKHALDREEEEGDGHSKRRPPATTTAEVARPTATDLEQDIEEGLRNISREKHTPLRNLVYQMLNYNWNARHASRAEFYRSVCPPVSWSGSNPPRHHPVVSIKPTVDDVQRPDNSHNEEIRSLKRFCATHSDFFCRLVPGFRKCQRVLGRLPDHLTQEQPFFTPPTHQDQHPNSLPPQSQSSGWGFHAPLAHRSSQEDHSSNQPHCEQGPSSRPVMSASPFPRGPRPADPVSSSSFTVGAMALRPDMSTTTSSAPHQGHHAVVETEPESTHIPTTTAVVAGPPSIAAATDGRSSFLSSVNTSSPPVAALAEASLGPSSPMGQTLQPASASTELQRLLHQQTAKLRQNNIKGRRTERRNKLVRAWHTESAGERRRAQSE